MRDVMAKLHQAEQRFESSSLHMERRGTMERVNAARVATYEKAGQHREDRTCHYCHKPGHIAANCHKKRDDKDYESATFAVSMRYE